MKATTNKQLFDSKEFENTYHTEAPLGAFCGETGTIFRLWAPTAQQVALRLYQAGSNAPAVEKIFLGKGEKGTWVYTTKRDMDGWYYDYEVTVDGVTRISQDPYAKACGVNGQRSMVIDLSRTNPEGWESDKAPAHTPEQIIYELHVKDFSWDKAGGFAEEDRGRFSALCREGTTLCHDGKHSTGLDYLKRLGVTHIQLLPVYDYGSVDETQPEAGYNWGYDPVNYNIPEGSYSSNPYRGEVRIRELKQAIAALHKHGFRVIMDVVYNHTYNLESPLFKTVPWYYYRQNEKGKTSNGSGCGNDIASERSMCRRYILESALYWIEEYHMDGFRFDLMGLLDDTLMNSLQAELDRRYGVGEKLVYGEPWRADNTYARAGTLLCDKGSLKRINPKIGAFCDDTRDAVKGSVMDEGSVGFVNGGTISAEKLRSCVAAWAGNYGDYGTPYQTITYLSCHDDWTLWDKLVYTMDPQKDFHGSAAKVQKANRLAAAINFCCQGRPFFLSGEEFGRTKGGVKNSYCSSAEVNQLDWRRAWQNQALVDYYRGFTALRQQLPGLQDKTEDAHKRILWAKDLENNAAAVCLDNRGGNSRWEQLLLIFCCGGEAQKLRLPEGKWQVLADGDSSFQWQLHVTLSGSCTVPAGSALILGKIAV